MTAASTHPAPARRAVSTAALWFGLAGGPAAWSVQTLVNLPVASHGCFPRLFPLALPSAPIVGPALVVSVAALTVCVAAVVVSSRTWLRTRGEHHDASGRGSAHEPVTASLETGEGRTRFMALAGVLASATFLLASLIHTAALVTIFPCAR